jgi:hypothetical protein
MSVETHMSTLSKNTGNRESEGKKTTSIRPKSLRRAQVVTSFLKVENITDFVSNAVDDRAKALAKKHKINLPDDAAFTV